MRLRVLTLNAQNGEGAITLPPVIAGDLNATPDAASIRDLSGLQSLDGHSVRYHGVLVDLDLEVESVGPGPS